MKIIHNQTWILFDDVAEERLSRSWDHAGHDALLDVRSVDIEKLLVELHGPEVVLARLAGGQETLDWRVDFLHVQFIFQVTMEIWTLLDEKSEVNWTITMHTLFLERLLQPEAAGCGNVF